MNKNFQKALEAVRLCLIDLEEGNTIHSLAEAQAAKSLLTEMGAFMDEVGIFDHGPSESAIFDIIDGASSQRFLPLPEQD